MTLYYVHDPMCSWCWGFRPTWATIHSSLANKIEIKYLLGGLAPDSNVPMPKTMQLQISGYWKKIQTHIPGTQFNYDFWDKCEAKRSTYPACRAVIAARKQNPDLEKNMIEAIQKAYYLNAQNPSDDCTLLAIADSLGLNKDAFLVDLNAKETQKQLESEIMMGQKIGAQGFPSMILEADRKYQTIPLNYNDAEGSIAFILERI